MKFQRSAEAFLARFGAETSHWDPNSLSALAPVVVPVAVIAHDRIDQERVLFAAGAEVASAAGFAPVFVIEPTRPIELVAITLGRIGGNLDGRAHFGPATAPGGGVADTRSSEGDPGAVVSALSILGAVTLGYPFVAPSQTVFEVPFVPLVLLPGRSLNLRSDNLGSTCRGGFVWRVLG